MTAVERAKRAGREREGERGGRRREDHLWQLPKETESKKELKGSRTCQ